MGYRRAIQYTPKVQTLAIRIFDSYPGSDNSSSLKLQDSSFFRILGYVFDDQDVDRLLEHYPDYDLEGLTKRNLLFNDELAKKILSDFQRLRDGCLDLLVHCTLGGSRSPAVGIALNEIFDLGYDSGELKERFSVYNRFVYRLLKEAR